MNWLLIILLAVIAFFLIHGWSKGLLRLLFSLISIIVMIVLVSYATPVVSGFIKEHTGAYTTIQKHCVESIQEKIEGNLEEGSDELVGSKDLAGIALPALIIDQFMDQTEMAIEETGVYEVLGTKAADLILKGISFFVALILVIILLRIIYAALGIADHIPIIKGLNRTLGLIGGAVEAYIVISLFFAFIALIAGTNLGQLATDSINSNPILSMMYYHNSILRFFSFI